MKTEFVKAVSVDDIPLELKELYIQAFPEEERRDWNDIARMVNDKDSVYNFYVIKHNGEIAGLITLWRLPETLYCEHLAIYPCCRNKGVGQEAVGLCIDRAGELPFLLEVELPDISPEARRRVGFYKRCGMKAMTGFPYRQPPYREGLPEVDLMLMVSRPLPHPDSVVRDLHRIVYNCVK